MQGEKQRALQAELLLLVAMILVVLPSVQVWTMSAIERIGILGVCLLPSCDI